MLSTDIWMDINLHLVHFYLVFIFLSRDTFIMIDSWGYGGLIKAIGVICFWGTLLLILLLTSSINLLDLLHYLIFHLPFSLIFLELISLLSLTDGPLQLPLLPRVNDLSSLFFLLFFEIPTHPKVSKDDCKGWDQDAHYDTRNIYFSTSLMNDSQIGGIASLRWANWSLRRDSRCRRGWNHPDIKIFASLSEQSILI